jgi:hypothetical protein
MRVITTVTTVLLATSLAASVEAGSIAFSSPPSRAPIVAEPSFVPGELIVQMRDGTSALEQERVLAVSGATSQHALGARSLAKSMTSAPLLRLGTRLDPREAARRLATDSAVAYAEPNWRIWPAMLPAELAYSDGTAWNLYGDDAPTATGPTGTTNAFGTQIEKAWAAGFTGRGGVFVGILDDGVATLHPDLANNCWKNPYDPVDSIDTDGNTLVDDREGWDFVNNDNTVYDGGVAGTTAHGTHVAGIIGAAANGQGSVGMAWIASMIPVKVMGASGGTVADAVEGLDYLTDMKQRHGLAIIAANCSWGTTAYSQALNDAVLRAARAGILIVCAAGNDGLDNDTRPVYPASFDTRIATSTMTAASFDAVISVAALDPNGQLASYSDRGAQSVDLAAPGTNILSCIPPSSYATWSGTSMAAPHVTGAILVFSTLNPGLSSQALRDAVLATAVPTPSLTGLVATSGRLDAWRLISSVQHDVAATALSAPASVTAGAMVAVSATVRNEGGQSETFTVGVVDVAPSGGHAGVVSPPRSVSLAAGASTTLAFAWNTTLATGGIHQLRAMAGAIVGETDMVDNVRTANVSVAAQATPVVAMVTPAQVRGGIPTRVTISGSGMLSGATVSFANGTGPQPTASQLAYASDGRSLAMTVTAAPTATIGVAWDVTVINPGGRLGRKLHALTIVP